MVGGLHAEGNAKRELYARGGAEEPIRLACATCETFSNGAERANKFPEGPIRWFHQARPGVQGGGWFSLRGLPLGIPRQVSPSSGSRLGFRVFPQLRAVRILIRVVKIHATEDGTIS